ncbi:hypothetical protein MLD38_008037 [Melastoma candidum]|uniref:Uncharacterized protein n=1 Tax=Melastoma candidum TaxID=119954 RepID=A0ACB9RTJ6_9MYRT|nr:hypothetical protein MLD38_008037 [Melastoma candidum]
MISAYILLPGEHLTYAFRFPRKLQTRMGTKSSFKSMSQLAWEVEKNFYVLDFEKVEQRSRYLRRPACLFTHPICSQKVKVRTYWGECIG